MKSPAILVPLGLAVLLVPLKVCGEESSNTHPNPGGKPSDSSKANVKWHPGHYAFVQFGPTDETHRYNEFRGVQKNYRWCELEPEKDRYDFSAIRADLACLGRHGQRLVIQVQTKTFGSGQNDCPACTRRAQGMP